MKPTLVSRNRLKISISGEDLRRMNISYDMIDYRDFRIRDILNDIIEDASEQTGFNSSGEKILVETLPQQGGGCVICVTRLPGGKRGKDSRHQASEPYIYRFDRLDDMLAAGAKICSYGDVLMGSLKVFSRGNKWYISFAPVLAGLDSFRLDCLLGSVSEFGTEISGGRLAEASLYENGAVIAEDETAHRLFSVMAR